MSAIGPNRLFEVGQSMSALPRYFRPQLVPLLPGRHLPRCRDTGHFAALEPDHVWNAPARLAFLFAQNFLYLWIVLLRRCEKPNIHFARAVGREVEHNYFLRARRNTAAELLPSSAAEILPAIDSDAPTTSISEVEGSCRRRSGVETDWLRFAILTTIRHYTNFITLRLKKFNVESSLLSASRTENSATTEVALEAENKRPAASGAQASAPRH
jgi:hypothetical protein